MYIPDHFAEPDPLVADRLIEANGFATLVSASGGGMTATHLPLLLDRSRGVLQGHVARANPHWQALDGAALAIFAGPHAYVSPRWYGPGPAVPTWNYEAVHVTGTARAIEDEAWLRAMLEALVRRYDPEWRLDALDPSFTGRMIRGVVGIEVAIDRIEVKRKLSQNRPAGDRDGVIAALERTGSDMDRALASAMREASVG